MFLVTEKAQSSSRTMNRLRTLATFQLIRETDNVDVNKQLENNRGRQSEVTFQVDCRENALKGSIKI